MSMVLHVLFTTFTIIILDTTKLACAQETIQRIITTIRRIYNSKKEKNSFLRLLLEKKQFSINFFTFILKR